MSATDRNIMTNGAGLLTLAGVFWLGVAVLRAVPVTPLAWGSLFASSVGVALLLWARGPGRARVGDWVSAALYVAWLAVFCYGVVRGLNALYGASRPRAHPENLLGGIELWTVLCPGALAVALAGAVRSLLIQRWGPRA